MERLSRIFLRKWPRHNGTALYILLGTRARNIEFVRQQHFVQVIISEECQWSALLTICLRGESTDTVGLPQQMANNAENISITWRVHDIFWLGSCRDNRLQILSSTVECVYNAIQYINILQIFVLIKGGFMYHIVTASNFSDKKIYQ